MTPQGPQIGDLVYVTGCENGELLLPEIILWDTPHLVRPIGIVRGTGPGDPCEGELVIILDIVILDEVPRYQIEATEGGATGWVTDSFIPTG